MLANINAGLLYIMAITSMGVYGVIIAGWASNSKYAFLGALRSAAQMVSYEIAMGFALVGVLMAVAQPEPVRHRARRSRATWGVARTGTGIPLFPLFLVYFISGVAETNRAPFDVAEGESEIVAGFHVEYSGMAFALFFLAEYANMILISDAVARSCSSAAGCRPARLCAVHLRSRAVVWLLRQDLRRRVAVPLVPRDLPALPLRPDHAPGLEGVHSGDARSGSWWSAPGCRRRCGVWYS